MTNLAEIKAIASRHASNQSTDLPRLFIFEIGHTTPLQALVYDPLVSLVLQGTKRTVIGNQVIEYSAGHCMMVAAEVAAMGQVCEASTGEPYIALNLFIDPTVIASLVAEMSGIGEPSSVSGFSVSKAGPQLLDAWARLISLLDRPEEIAVMARNLEHELMFRFLMGPQGAMLRQIASSDGRLAHIRRAMSWIREHYAEHLTVEEMAEVAAMSVSVFHRRFKGVTGQSPLQYQKQIRLHEARRRLVVDQIPAATVGFSVGYESPSQFSREYRRLFGAPPRQHAAATQTMVETGL